MHDHPALNAFKILARRAGKIIVSDFGKNVECRRKPDGSIVTETDNKVNDLVIEFMKSHFPKVSVVSEEGSNVIRGAKFAVLCDPLDGTIPFSIGLPVSTFCISLIRRGRPIMAIIYDPFMKRMWHAVRGKGAFLNDEPVKVSEHQGIYRSRIAFGTWNGAITDLNNLFKVLVEKNATWVNPASIVLCGGLLASGNLEATVFPGNVMWETAAMDIIVTEAGGKATDLEGNPLRYDRGSIKGHLITNGLVHKNLLDLIQI